MPLKSSPALAQFPKINVLLTILFASLILHICTTLSYSYFSNFSAYDRLQPHLKKNSMNILEPITAERQLLPYLSSDTQLAICHYDTSQNNVIIKAILPEQGWSIVLYDKKGISLYSDVANTYGKTLVDLYLVPDDNRFLGISKETQIQTNSFNQILVKATEGLAVIRTIDAGYAYNNRSKEILQKASCYEEKSSQ